MAQTILEQQTLTDFVFNETFNAYIQDVYDCAPLTIGETYKVLWDNVEYIVTAQDTNDLIPNSASIGNLSFLGLAGNNEPFAIVSGNAVSANGIISVASLTDTEPTPHTVAIYTTKKVILQKLMFYSQFITEYGVFGITQGFGTTIPAFDLALGDECIVVWDKIKYPVIVSDASSVLSNVLYVGNGVGFGLPGNNEPFAVAWDGTGVNVFALTDRESTEHYVEIYQIETETNEPNENSNAIVLKDRDGNDMQPFEGVGKIKVHTADGGLRYFAHGEPVDKTIELNFADGDMEITPEAGTVFSKVYIPKPATLIPPNVAEDIEIAGVAGEHSGGGGVAPVLSKAINFYDVEGNIVHSYTRAEAALLTELPEVPELGTLEGSWSHTLEQVQAAKAFLDVGATYKKNGNLTVVAVIERPKSNTTFYYNFYAVGACTINMYSNPSTDTILTTKTRTTAGAIQLSHIAAATAVPLKQFVVFEIIATGVRVYLGCYSGTVKPFFGNSTSKSVLTGAYNLLSVVCSLDSNNSLYLQAERYSFYYDYKLKHICCYSINTYASTVYSFYYCYSLKSIVTNPSEATTVNILGNYIFYNCQSLRRVVLGKATSTNTSTLNNIMNLRSVILHYVSQVNFPSYAPQELIITTTSTPGTSITLGTNAAQNLRAIYVPDELVDTYKTNWSGYAGIIRSLSQYPDY